MRERSRMIPLLLLLSTLAGLLLLSASPTPQAQSGSVPLTVNPYDVIFDNVTVGNTATKSVKVTNPGSAGVAIAKIFKYGPAPSDFALVSDGCTGTTVAAAGTCTFSVVFSPAKKGTRVAHLRIDSNLGCPTFLTLAGSGPHQTSSRRAECTASASPTPTPSASASPSPTPAPGGGVRLRRHRVDRGLPGRTKVRINFHTGVRERLRLKTAKATVGGRTLGVKRNQKRLKRIRGYYYSVLQFKGLTAPRYKVKVRGKLTNGKSFARNRVFKNCISSA